MSDPRKNGGPAFPVEHAHFFYYGMSLRDWFAGQALKGMLANSPTSRTPDDFVADAYDYANRMLIHRAIWE